MFELKGLQAIRRISVQRILPCLDTYWELRYLTNSIHHITKIVNFAFNALSLQCRDTCTIIAPMTDPNLLKDRRTTASVTQEALAEAVGVSRQTIISIEKGKYTPSVSLAIRIARFFKTPVEEIFTGQ